MKKGIAILLCVLMAAAAFGNGGSEGSDAGPIVLKFGVNSNTESVEYASAVQFAETLESASGGSMVVEIFPNGQLGDAKEMLDQISMDELDIYMEPIGGLSTFAPELSVLEMAYVVKDLDHIGRILKSDWGTGIKEKLSSEMNIYVLGQTLFGTRQTTSNRPLNSIEDYEGLRIRTPNSAALKAWAEAMGARPTSIAFAEVYLALKTNSVDAQENPLPTINAMKFYEAQSAVAIDNHLVQDKSILLSATRWESLSSDQKKWMEEAADAAKQESLKLINEQSESLIGFFESNGLVVTYPDTAPMQKAMVPYYEAVETDLGVPGLISEIVEM